MLRQEERLDERAESPLGRLFLQHLRQPGLQPGWAIDADCYDAGSRYASIVGEYRATIEGPRTTGGSGRGLDCVAQVLGRDACRFDPDNCECFRRKQRYDRAFETLTIAGRNALRAVNRVVIQRLDPADMEEIFNLVAGLSALARCFGLTRAGARPHYQNTH